MSPTAPIPPVSADELAPRLARRVLAQMGENGTPPERGIQHINVGNESYLEILDRVYLRELLREAGGSSFKLVQGTYGAGKTHFLYCVRDLAWSRNLLAAFITISPRETPMNKPLAVYRAVAHQLERAPGHQRGEPVRGIDDVLRRVAEQRREKDGRDAALHWADARLGRAPIDRHSFRDAAARYVRAVIEGNEQSVRRLAAWLRGEALPAIEAKAEGLYEVPGNDNGFAMLRALVQVVARVGFAGTAFLLDEAERRLSLDGKPSKAQNETVDHLRELVDLCGRSELPRALVLYAVTPAFVQNVLPAYPALQQRLGWPVQYLSPHNPKAPLIDLEALDLEPVRLLTEVGARLFRVARRAYTWQADPGPIQRNLSQLVRTVTHEQLEVSHRRLFVKIWIRLLDELRIGGSRDLAPDEIRALVRDEQVQLLEDDLSGQATFFGQPVRTAGGLAGGGSAGGSDSTVLAPERRRG
jgi:hypothetical protein